METRYKIFLDKNQIQMVQDGLDSHIEGLRSSMQKTPPVSMTVQDTVDGRICQAEILMAYLDRFLERE